jgi:hypothetical protein
MSHIIFPTLVVCIACAGLYLAVYLAAGFIIWIEEQHTRRKEKSKNKIY